MDTLIEVITKFVENLPPLLQLLLGVFITGGFFKLTIMVADHFEKRGEKKKDN